jgi:hypothetical protein
MAGYDGAGSLFALGLRLTKLDAAGAPLVGAGNCYTTTALAKIGLNNTYSEPDVIEFKNGSGVTCVYYAPPKTLQGGAIEDFQICTPDPLVLQFACGGDLITSGGTNEVQTVTITGTPTGGTFTLTFGGQTTSSIAYNAISSAVQTAFQALSTVGTGNATVTGGPGPGTPYVITFGGALGSTNVANITATGSFTGGTSPAIAVANTTPGVAGTTVIGYRAPAVNVDPNPNGIAIEAWSRAILNNSFAASLPYFHWVLPRARLNPSEAITLEGENALTPTFEGLTEQNAGFGDGAVGDITMPTDRIYQYCRVATIPDLTAGLVTVT